MRTDEILRSCTSCGSYSYSYPESYESIANSHTGYQGNRCRGIVIVGCRSCFLLGRRGWGRCQNMRCIRWGGGAGFAEGGVAGKAVFGGKVGVGPGGAGEGALTR